MLDPTLPLTSEEQEEWGSGASSFSPLDPTNLILQSSVLLTVAGRDRRAPPWHAANFITSLSNDARVHVHLLEDADHTGFSETADEVERKFLMDEGEKSCLLYTSPSPRD